MNSICLRAMTEDDLEFVLAAENDPEHAPFVGRWEREQHLSALTSEEFASFVVTDPQGLPVGHVILAECTNVTDNVFLKRIIITQKGQGLRLGCAEGSAADRVHLLQGAPPLAGCD